MPDDNIDMKQIIKKNSSSTISLTTSSKSVSEPVSLIDEQNEEEDVGSVATSSSEESDSSLQGAFSHDLMDIDLVFDDYKAPKVIFSEQINVDQSSLIGLVYEGVYYFRNMGFILSIVCYRDLESKTEYCFYKSFKSHQTKLLNYCLFCIANIGLIAFLIQVFDTRDWLSLIIVTIQLLFIVVCIVELCVIRWAFAKTLKEFSLTIEKVEQVTTIVFVRVDNFCMELDIKSMYTEDDLSYKETCKSTARWALLVVIQLLTIVYFISCMVGSPPPNIQNNSSPPQS